MVADFFWAVGSLQAADGEVALGEALEVVREHDVEGKAAGGSGYRDQLGGGFLAYLQAEAGGDAGEERDEDRGAFLRESLLGDVAGGVSGGLRERGAGGVVGRFHGLGPAAFWAERKDLQAGERGLRGGEVFALRLRDPGDGVQDDGGGEGELDDQAGQAEEAADGTRDSRGDGVRATAGGASLAVSGDEERDLEAALECDVDRLFNRPLGGVGKEAQEGLDRHADLLGDGHGEALTFELLAGLAEVVEIFGSHGVRHGGWMLRAVGCSASGRAKSADSYELTADGFLRLSFFTDRGAVCSMRLRCRG